MMKLENLNHDELILTIEFLPMNEMIQFVSKSNKKLKSKFPGADYNKKSKVLTKRIPIVFAKLIDDGDKLIFDFVRKLLFKKLKEINEYLKFSADITESIEIVLQRKQSDEYVNLMIVLLEKIESKYIMLFLKLNGFEFKVRQKKLAEKSIQEAVQYKVIREKICINERKKLEKNYEDEIKLIKKKTKDLLNIEKIENKSLKNQLLEKDLIIKEKNETYNNLKNKLKLLEIEFKRVGNELKNDKKNYFENINKRLEKIKNLETLNKEKDLKIKQLDNELKEKYEIYSKEYRIRWNAEHQLLVDEQVELLDEFEIFSDRLKNLQEEILTLEIEKEAAQEKLKEYNNIVSDFIKNIDKEVIKTTLEASMLNIDMSKTKINEKENIFMYIKNEIEGTNIRFCKNIDDWKNNIVNNLKEIGVRKYRKEWSNYIISLLSSKIIPLIIGCKTREIAKTISYTYSGKSPFIITLSDSFVNINKLIDIYINSDSKVILIEGIIGHMNESLVIPLFKEYVENKDNDTIILISCEDNTMLDLIPMYMMEYVGLVKIEDIRPVLVTNYICSDCIDLLYAMRTNELNINRSYKIISKLLKNMNVNNAYLITRALILAYLFHEVESDIALECLMICDLKLICKDEDMTQKIINNIDNYPNEFPQKIISLIEGKSNE